NRRRPKATRRTAEGVDPSAGNQAGIRSRKGGRRRRDGRTRRRCGAERRPRRRGGSGRTGGPDRGRRRRCRTGTARRGHVPPAAGGRRARDGRRVRPRRHRRARGPPPRRAGALRPARARRRCGAAALDGAGDPARLRAGPSPPPVGPRPAAARRGGAALALRIPRALPIRRAARAALRPARVAGPGRPGPAQRARPRPDRRRAGGGTALVGAALADGRELGRRAGRAAVAPTPGAPRGARAVRLARAGQGLHRPGFRPRAPLRGRRIARPRRGTLGPQDAGPPPGRGPAALPLRDHLLPRRVARVPRRTTIPRSMGPADRPLARRAGAVRRRVPRDRGAGAAPPPRAGLPVARAGAGCLRRGQGGAARVGVPDGGRDGGDAGRRRRGGRGGGGAGGGRCAACGKGGAGGGCRAGFVRCADMAPPGAPCRRGAKRMISASAPCGACLTALGGSRRPSPMRSAEARRVPYHRTSRVPFLAVARVGFRPAAGLISPLGRGA
ncbi:hypothetical protein DFJ74DRAFT_721547, partial [Hyaloraphidium curvatum]